MTDIHIVAIGTNLMVETRQLNNSAIRGSMKGNTNRAKVRRSFIYFLLPFVFFFFFFFLLIKMVTSKEAWNLLIRKGSHKESRDAILLSSLEIK